jgi:hypothetical protein
MINVSSRRKLNNTSRIDLALDDDLVDLRLSLVLSRFADVEPGFDCTAGLAHHIS